MSDHPSAGAELIIRTDRPANGGEAVGRVDGRVVFVRGAVPGELVRVRITDDRQKSFARAEMIEIVEASPHRIESRCDAARHGAGCCDLGFIEVGHSRDLKGQILVDALGRIGRFGPADLDAAGVGSGVVADLGDDGTHWRVRTRLGVDADGRAGMHAFHGSAIVTGHRCAAPESGMLDDLDALTVAPGADLIVVADRDGRRHITELAAPKQPARRHRGGARGRTQSARRRRDAPRGRRVVEGDAIATHRVGDRVWRIPVAGFWQAHGAAPTVYARTVVELLGAAGLPGRTGDTVAWDLYGGAGVLGAALLDGAAAAGLGEFTAVHVVETDADAVAVATEAFAGDDRLTVHHGEVAALVGGLPAPDVVVLDPPRTGAGPAVIDAVADADPSAIVHVGCDVGRFARDLALFAEHGYRPREIRAFDAFPLTHHVEAIACLVPARGL
ncbi:class I SAM-dependent RNA methyltransferase [Gordonia insulae]|uniref:23S rRNA (Uracil-C(5))-methyltransferase RlmCD n=1 Tax=Gordonia insulae TaxID=2420509 RepID=A0A3G8JJ11_9ACTN|nr:TRAM domain-containing protein [Gordonia insulae]AZG44200.1 23S rRNA (uracil-C(5))-methyltransferase RlmCD [Gordonia insulae]